MRNYLSASIFPFSNSSFSRSPEKERSYRGFEAEQKIDKWEDFIVPFSSNSVHC